MPFKSVQDYLDDPQTTTAERLLIEHVKSGTPCILNNGTLPPEGDPTDATKIRAPLLRLLIMGGTEACGLHPSGVLVEGAYIYEILDLSFTSISAPLFFLNCAFDQELYAAYCRAPLISLKGCRIKGLNLQGAKIRGDIFLSDDFHSAGTISLSGAEIGGQVNCFKAHIFAPVVNLSDDIESQESLAIFAQGMRVAASFSLEQAKVTGKIHLGGTDIGGQLILLDTVLDGALGKAFHGQSMGVKQGLIWVNVTILRGAVDLSGAEVSDLCDEIRSWPHEPDNLMLNGFIYHDIAGDSPLTYSSRKVWLAIGSHRNGTFHPQPYTQFAKVLREMGHASEARKVIMERERILFDEAWKADHARYVTEKAALNARWWGLHKKWSVFKIWNNMRLRHFWASLSSRVVGYGHAPERALFWSLRLILAGTIMYCAAYHFGLMVPNSDVIMVSPDWLAAIANNHDAPTLDWLKNAPSAAHYETFYSLYYATDVFLPLVDFGQESTWAATTTTNAGIAIRFFTFAYQIAGWVITALGIAAITGFVQKGTPD